MKLYTKTVCPQCLFVKRDLADKGIVLDSVNIDHDESAKALLLEHNIMTVPALHVDGAFITNAFDIIIKASENA